MVSIKEGAGKRNQPLKSAEIVSQRDFKCFIILIRFIINRQNFSPIAGREKHPFPNQRQGQQAFQKTAHFMVCKADTFAHRHRRHAVIHAHEQELHPLILRFKTDSSPLRKASIAPESRRDFIVALRLPASDSVAISLFRYPSSFSKRDPYASGNWSSSFRRRCFAKAGKAPSVETAI